METDSVSVLFPDGTVRFFQGERLHRHGGPAVIRADGTTEWWVWGYPVDIEEEPARAAPNNRAG